tara:strand:+ start:16735 stop:18726 length:1992 start_codon:yes stop_codon:yes gene_type:complete
MIEIYIGSEKIDTFKDEDVNIRLNIQNVKDISKLFTDYTQNFQVPASKKNNAVFKHYYNADISDGYTATLRQPATLFVNKEVFREGSIELISVDMKQNQARAYEIVFYSAGVNLKDLFGEDELTSLDLSAYDHPYDGAVIRGAMEGTTPLHSGNIIYPLISPVNDWFYDSASNVHNDNDIAFHTQNDDHGLHYYDLKPAIRISKLIDAIEAKYGITFTSTFFTDSKFTDLFLWGHRREGYMFKDQENGFTAQKVDFTSSTGSGFDTTTDTYTNNILITGIIWRYSITSTNDYQVHFYVNGVYATSRSHSGNVTNSQVFLNGLSGGDKVQMRFSPPVNWDGSTTTIASVSADGRISNNAPILWTATTTTSQSFNTDVVVSDQMPEQKVYDFILGLVKMFNLVIEPTSRTKFIIEPLDDWYASGSNYDITDHVDIASQKVNKPELYRRISFNYQESGSYLEEAYRNVNGGIGYGDLRADFNFDAGDLSTESTFELMRYTKLPDLDGGITGFLVGKSIDKEGDPYIGEPVIFYSPSTLNISGKPIGFLDESGQTDTATNQVYLCGNINNRVAGDVTQMLTYGLDVDPFHEQSFSQTLYNQFWEDYITDLYSTSRRIYSMEAVLPFKVAAKLRMNDKLDINGRRYVINQMQINLRTEEATLELLNDV